MVTSIKADKQNMVNAHTAVSLNLGESNTGLDVDTNKYIALRQR